MPYPAAAPSPSLPPDPVYWFAADSGAFADAAGTVPCVDGAGVYTWGNQGIGPDDAVQSNAANRPIFRTGGLKGKPYLDVQRSAPHWFANLTQGSQPSGFTTFNPYSVFAVVDQVTIGSDSTLFGSSGVLKTSTAKGLVAFSSGTPQTFYFYKGQTQLALPAQGGPNVVAGTKRSDGVGFFDRGNQSMPMTWFNEGTNSNTAAASGMMFLRHGSTPSNYFNGRLYEVLYYGRDLSEADGNAVLDYLKAKYGIA